MTTIRKDDEVSSVAKVMFEEGTLQDTGAT